jgi:hypothetical protein
MSTPSKFENTVLDGRQTIEDAVRLIRYAYGGKTRYFRVGQFEQFRLQRLSLLATKFVTYSSRVNP